MTKKIFSIAIVIASLMAMAMPYTAHAGEIKPFDSVNQHPLISLFGLPGPGHYLVLPPGQTEIGLDTVLSSNYATDQNIHEQVTIDGETTRFTVTARRTVFPRLEIGLKIPYIVQGGGFLDGFIENYHDAFGFPQGGRDQAPHNRLLYTYRRDGVEKLHFSSSGGGIGDVRLSSSFQLIEHRDMEEGITLNAGIKLPTGESDQLRGSGSTDFSLWLSGGTSNHDTTGTWTTYGAAGLLLMNQGDVLPDQQKSWAGFGSLGVGWAPLTWLAFKVQADAHTSFFSDSDLEEISANSLQLIVGGTLFLSERTTLDIGVGEDLAVNTAPDVSFYLSLRTRF